MAMFRQGDVLIVAIAAIPAGVTALQRENGGVVLAHGEATGHAHAIKGPHVRLFRDPEPPALFLRVSGNAPVALEHQEHDTIHIPPGDYHVIRQREYSPEAIRNVAD
jgi:hypothetical protein